MYIKATLILTILVKYRTGVLVIIFKGNLIIVFMFLPSLVESCYHFNLISCTFTSIILCL